jgi:hypothetical protein
MLAEDAPCVRKRTKLPGRIHVRMLQEEDAIINQSHRNGYLTKMSVNHDHPALEKPGDMQTTVENGIDAR